MTSSGLYDSIQACFYHNVLPRYFYFAQSIPDLFLPPYDKSRNSLSLFLSSIYLDVYLVLVTTSANYGNDNRLELSILSNRVYREFSMNRGADLFALVRARSSRTGFMRRATR